MTIHLRNFMLFCLLLFFCCNKTFGQEKVNISAGIGTSEAFFLGLRFQLQQSQLGFSIGGGIITPIRGFSVTGDYYYHFGGSSDLSARRPWYCKSSLSYSKVVATLNTASWLFLDIRIGRDINFSKNLGMAIDVGPSITLLYKTSGIAGGIDYPVYPSMSLSFFYRLNPK
jgi:hypothetical protein